MGGTGLWERSILHCKPIKMDYITKVKSPEHKSDDLGKKQEDLGKGESC